MMSNIVICLAFLTPACFSLFFHFKNINSSLPEGESVRESVSAGFGLSNVMRRFFHLQPLIQAGSRLLNVKNSNLDFVFLCEFGAEEIKWDWWNVRSCFDGGQSVCVGGAFYRGASVNPETKNNRRWLNSEQRLLPAFFLQSVRRRRRMRISRRKLETRPHSVPARSFVNMLFPPTSGKRQVQISFQKTRRLSLSVPVLSCQKCVNWQNPSSTSTENFFFFFGSDWLTEGSGSHERSVDQ